MRGGEVPVTLVLAGHGHDRAGAVAHEHVVGDVQRDRCTRERVLQVGAGEHAPLVERALGLHAVDVARLAGVGGEGGDLGGAIGRGHGLDQRVLRGDHRIGHAEARVGPGGEHADRDAAGGRCAVGVGHDHLELGALGSSDPVALHDLDLLGPGQLVEVVEQLVGVVGDLEEPLLEIALLDQRAGSLGRPVGQHLLVGQHRLVDRIPVHLGVLAIGQARLEQAQEDPLRPPDVLGIVTGDLATPVVATTDAHERPSQLLDALVGEPARVHPRLDGRVLGGKAEGVEPHRREHGVPVHRAVARDQVAEGVVPDVAHVRLPARIGVHAERVVVGSRVVVVDLVGALVAPARLPLGLDRLDVVALCHPGIVSTGPRPPETVPTRHPGRPGGFGRDHAGGRVSTPSGAIAQVVERFHGMEEAEGSSPSSSTAPEAGGARPGSVTPPGGVDSAPSPGRRARRTRAGRSSCLSWRRLHRRE